MRHKQANLSAYPPEQLKGLSVTRRLGDQIEITAPGDLKLLMTITQMSGSQVRISCAGAKELRVYRIDRPEGAVPEQWKEEG